jgi:hypothetical protein
MLSPLSRFLAVLPVLLGIVAMSGCSKPKLEIDSEYSWNLVRPNQEWPGEKPEEILKPAELEAFAAYGRPDAVRIIYDASRRIITRTEVDTKFVGKKPKKVEDFERSYVYAIKKVEVVMHPSGEIEEIPLNDQLRIVYEHGDPESRTSRPNSNQETWVYYSLGRRFLFLDGELIGEEKFQPMGRWKKT